MREGHEDDPSLRSQSEDSHQHDHREGNRDSHGCSTRPAAATWAEDHFGDGTYRVGVDIAPGTYQTATPTSCYWARLRGFSGGFGDIISNGLYVGIVTISPSDLGFLSQRCGTWTKIE